MNHPLYTRGPRRGGADKNGDTVWVNQFFAGRLAKINIHTRKVTDYKLPGALRYGAPYFSVVDKDHMVWFSLANADYVGKLNPFTEQFTFYPLPTRGYNGRHRTWIIEAISRRSGYPRKGPTRSPACSFEQTPRAERSENCEERRFVVFMRASLAKQT